MPPEYGSSMATQVEQLPSMGWALVQYNVSCVHRNDPFSGTILPPQIPIYHNGMSSVHEVDQSLEARDELLRQLKINLETSINRMK